MIYFTWFLVLTLNIYLITKKIEILELNYTIPISETIQLKLLLSWYLMNVLP